MTFGFGFGSHRNSSSRFVVIGQDSSLPVIVPSSAWNGTAGSGFSTVPADPVRVTAKPAMQLIVPPNQFYSDELLVGVMAGASDGGSMVANMGLRRVVVHCEGASRTIDSPSFQTFADANGTYRTHFGWWTILRNDGRHGHVQVYFEAVPNDASMQSRVMGPYQFSPQAHLHDASVTVAAAGPADFTSIAAAIAHCRSSAFQNPLVTITEAGSYDIADGTQAYEGQGYCTIAASVPGVRIAKPGYTSDAAGALRSRYGGLRFKGANLTIDMRYISEIYSEAGATRSHWLDGCNVVSSDGPGALWRGVTRPVNWMVRDGGWFTECTVDDCGNTFRLAKLVRGTTETDGVQDLYSGCPTVVGNVSSGHRSDTTLATEIPALSVRYSGTAATATIELAGANSATTRTVTVKIAGSADRTYALHKTEAAYASGSNYTLQQLVAWLNTIPSVTATLIDSTSGRAAAWLSLAGLTGGAFGARDIKAAALTLVTYIDVSGSWWEAGTLTENVIIWDNLATGTVARDFNLGGTEPKRDFLIANNAIQNVKTAPQSAALASEFDGANSHVVVVHNTLSTQGIIFRTDSAYSSNGHDLLANNSVRSITWSGAAGAAVIRNNHIHAGQTEPASAAGQPNVSGTTIGGDDFTLYVNDRGGDFRANGPLVTSLAPSLLRYNASGQVLSATDVKGAFAIGPQVPVTIARSVTQYGITYTFSEDRPVAQYPTGDWRVLGPVTITSMSPASTRMSGTYYQGGTYPLSWVHGAQVNPGNRSWALGGLAANNKDNQPQGLNGIPSSTNYSGTGYSHASNQDPAATGQPLDVTTGSVMKFVSLIPPSTATRPGGADMAVLTVVDDLGPQNALRPGVATSAKTHLFTEDDWDLTVFKNFLKPPTAPSAAQAIANVQRAYALQFTDSVNSENAHAGNNHPSYGREISVQVYTSALCLHLDYTPAEKRAILNGLYGIAIDWFERLREGGECMVPAGGGNQWKKCVLVIVTAALRNAANTAARDALRAMCDAQRNYLMAEDKQMRPINQAIIETPRVYDITRERDVYTQWMEGAVDFAEGARGSSDYGAGGPNWDAPYRVVFCNAAIGGILAVMATTGAKALWNRDEVFEYYRFHYAKELALGTVGAAGDSNYIPAFFRDVLAMAWPADPNPPTVVAAKVKDNVLWLRFDKALDFNAVVELSDHTVKVNGATISGIERGKYVLGPAPSKTAGARFPNGIFNTNVGIILPGPVTALDRVTYSYAGGTGANKLRSALHNVNVAPIADMPVENVTPSVGGINLDYPIVAFSAVRQDRLQVAGAKAFDTQNTPTGTIFFPRIRLEAAPIAAVKLLSAASGSATIECQIRSSDRRMNLLLRNGGGSAFVQIRTPALAVGVDYWIAIAWDTSQLSSSAGCNIVINGTAYTSLGTWSTDGTINRDVKWSEAQNYAMGIELTGHFGGVYLNCRERVSLAGLGGVSGVPSKFFEGQGTNLSIGTLGVGITGRQPELFIMGNAAQYNDADVGINRGSGPKFFRSPTTALTDVSSLQAASRWS
jgi:hypothetical protein